MRTDSEIQRDVENELEWDPDIDETNIAVKVNDGVVALTGFVPSYSDKYAAERIAKRILGVKAVANDLEVKLESGRTPTSPATPSNGCSATFPTARRISRSRYGTAGSRSMGTSTGSSSAVWRRRPSATSRA